ncbi:unnamed protein product, partial [Cylicocyclus nassatus]
SGFKTKVVLSAFHFLFLPEYHTGSCFCSARKMVSKSQTAADKAGDEAPQAYAVEKILKMRKRAGKMEFLLKWEGYPVKEATWEAERDCDCEDLIKEFLKNSVVQKGLKSKLRGKSRKDITVKLTKKIHYGARRATLKEIKGVVSERKRTPNKKQTTPKPKLASSASSKKEVTPKSKKENGEKPPVPSKRRASISPKSLSSAKGKTEEKKPRKETEVNETPTTTVALQEKTSAPPSGEQRSSVRSKRLSNIRALPPSRDGSCISDESSTPVRFLKLKRKNDEIAAKMKASNVSSPPKDQVYKVQQGQKIEKIAPRLSIKEWNMFRRRFFANMRWRNLSISSSSLWSETSPNQRTKSLEKSVSVILIVC